MTCPCNSAQTRTKTYSDIPKELTQEQIDGIARGITEYFYKHYDIHQHQSLDAGVPIWALGNRNGNINPQSNLLLLQEPILSSQTGTTIRLYPTADTYVSDFRGLGWNDSNINFGTSGTILAGSFFSIFVGWEAYETLMRFDLSSIPANSIIKSAKLNLYMIYPSSGYGGNLKIRDIPVANRTWTETGVTWNNKPVYNFAYPNIYVPDGTMNNWTITDITSYIIDQYNAGIGADFYIGCYESPGGTHIQYISKDSTDIVHRPYLEVTYILRPVDCPAPKLPIDIVISKINNQDISANPKIVVGTNTIYGNVTDYTGKPITGSTLKLKITSGSTTLIDTTIQSTSILPNYIFNFQIPELLNSVDIRGKSVSISISYPGDSYCHNEVILDTVIDGIGINTDKTTAATGESIRFFGSYHPDTALNLYYCTKTSVGTIWREHVVSIKTDGYGDYDIVAILPSDTTDAYGNLITTSAPLDFRICTPGIWPTECTGGVGTCTADIVSRPISIMITAGTPLNPAPGTYIRRYPDTDIYSGKAKLDHIEVKTFKYFSPTDTREISQEEALYNILMGIETGAIQNNTPLLLVQVSYTDGDISSLYYVFDIKITYYERSIVLSGGTIIQSLAIPLVPIIVGVIVIIGLYILYRIVEATIDLIYGPGASKCPEYTAQQQCEAGGCKWKDGVCSPKPSAIASGLGLLLAGAGALLLLSAGGKTVSAIKAAAPKYIEEAKKVYRSE